MARAKPREVAPPALAHGDYRFDNTVMNDDYKIVAVLDWELCTIGNPVADFAWSMLYWTDPGATMFVPQRSADARAHLRAAATRSSARYQARSGFDLSDLPYYPCSRGGSRPASSKARTRDGSPARRAA